MKELNSNDYVIYHKKEHSLLQFADRNGEVIIYGCKDEATADLDKDEEVVSCTELPYDLQQIILKQIN